jgi:hypothetical protein
MLLNRYVIKKFKKTREKLFKNSQKLKITSVVGINVIAMTMFYSMLLL